MNLKKITLLCCLTAFSFDANSQTSFAPLVEELMPMVVNISTEVKHVEDLPNVSDSLIFEDTSRETLGSGFVVDAKGYIVTNYHVIEKADEISVIDSKGNVYKASLVGQDNKTDIALIKIEPTEEMLSVVFGDSDKVLIGDWVLAIGNPFGLGSSVTAGIISAKARDIGDSPYNNYLQTDASINQGNSGGPLFNISGEVIGINTAMFSNSGNSVGVGFSLPSNDAIYVINQLQTKGKVERGWLGIEVKKAVTKDNVVGLAITSLLDEQLAEKNGLKVGDVIIKLNSETLQSVKDFSYKISMIQPDTEVELTLWRDSEILNKKVTVKLEEEQVKENISNTSTQNGEYYPELKAYINNLTITGLDKQSDLVLKGVNIGDKIIKINNKNISSTVDLRYSIFDASINKEKLRFDMKDTNNTSYFVEVNL